MAGSIGTGVIALQPSGMSETNKAVKSADAVLAKAAV